MNSLQTTLRKFWLSICVLGKFLSNCTFCDFFDVSQFFIIVDFAVSEFLTANYPNSELKTNIIHSTLRNTVINLVEKSKFFSILYFIIFEYHSKCQIKKHWEFLVICTHNCKIQSLQMQEYKNYFSNAAKHRYTTSLIQNAFTCIYTLRIEGI